MRINNNNYQKNANISLVAQMIWKTPGISRVAIARELDLYRSTVTTIISTLLENHVVYEGEEGSGMSKGGRKPITLRLNEKFGCVVGFDIQPSHFRAVVVDVTGAVLWHESGNLPKVSFDGILTFLMDMALKEILILGLPLLAVCAGVPGIVDADNGIILYAEPFKLHDYDFFSFFKKHYHVPSFVENDANCTTWLEMTINRNINLDDFMCIIADYHEGNYQFGDCSGIGVGLGLCINKKVYAGAYHASGELCTLSWKADSVGQSGLPKELLVRSALDNDAWETWMTDFFASLVPAVSIIDPRVVFIHGKPFSDSDRIFSLLDSKCPQFKAVLKKRGCQLIFNAKDDTVVAKGAAAMFLQKLFAVPELSEMESRTHFDWEDVVKQANYPMNHYEKKMGGGDIDE
ncbi:MAG: ROK family transcriptional regulator [Sphaerochaetaceae bacterium]